MRSSATAEDLPSASFAGQQDTYLNVVGADARAGRGAPLLGLAVDRPRGELPRSRPASTTARCRLAVVVQRMLDAELAGVLFTADPLTGRRTRTVIDAAPGLGEAVVSGAVNPDHVVVEGDGTIAEYRVGDKVGGDPAAGRWRHRAGRRRAPPAAA